MFAQIWENIKQHPWLYGGGAVLGIIIVYFIFRGGGSGTAVDPTAANYATETAAATALQQAQLQAQSSNYAAQQAVAVQQANISGQEAIAQIQSNTQLGVATLQAGVLNNQTAATTAQTKIAADTAKYQSTLSAQVAEGQTAATKAANLASIAAGVTQSQIASQTSLGLANISAAEHEYLAATAANEANTAAAYAAQTAQTTAAYAAQTAQLSINTQAQTNQALISEMNHQNDLAAQVALQTAANQAAQISANAAASAQAAALAQQQEADKLAYASGPGYSLQAFATAMSDRRRKFNIRKVGRLSNGLHWYSFRYKGDNVEHIGLMSDEVRQIRPGAVSVDYDGYDMVDYSLAVQ